MLFDFKRLKSYLKVLVVAFALLPVIFACEKGDYWINPGKDEAEAPVKAPDFSLATTGGDTISLAGLEGRVVVLFFFSHSCAPCRTAAVNVEAKLHKPREARDDYAVLGIEASNANLSAVNSFRSLTGVTFPLLMNRQGSHDGNYRPAPMTIKCV